MCLLLIALNQHPSYPVIILSNRDEFNNRPTANANFWDENPHIFSGRDLKEGGAWFGVTKNNCFASITNFRNPSLHHSSKISRGFLVKNYLLRSANISPLEFLKETAQHADDYNGFNLIIGNTNEVFYYSNIEKEIKQITNGVYCVSNHLLDTPWYKVIKAKQLFIEKKDLISTYADPDKITEELYPILSDNTFAPDNQLPNTGVGEKLEKLLSPIFIDLHAKGEYGTQNSSIALMGNKKEVVFYEKIFTKGVLKFSKKVEVNQPKRIIKSPTHLHDNNFFSNNTLLKKHITLPNCSAKKLIQPRLIENGMFKTGKNSIQKMAQIFPSILKK